MIAPAVDDDARGRCSARKANMRVVIADFSVHAARPDRGIGRRAAVDSRRACSSQERDRVVEARRPWSADALPEGLRVVTRRQPTADEWEALRFAWRICAHVKSNTVIFTDAQRTLAIGAGQMSRVDAVQRGGHESQRRRPPADRVGRRVGRVLPVPRRLDAVAAAGATAVVQPGGSVRDAEVIAAADEHGLAMVFTGRRHFRH